jgi:hypothetical protein
LVITLLVAPSLEASTSVPVLVPVEQRNKANVGEAQ